MSAASARLDVLAQRPTRRAMRPADLDAVLPIEREIYPFPWTRNNFADSIAHGYDTWLLEYAAADAPSGPAATLPAEPVVAGYAVVMWILDETHLLNISIAAPFQRRGLGAWFLGELIADGARRGATSMLLEVRPSNPNAQALYRRAGFHQIGLRRDYYPSWNGAREDAIVMSRAIGRGDAS